MKTTFQRTITNELHSLGDLMSALTNFLEDQGVDAQAVYRINLAMEEMITNIIKYGYDDYDTHNIEVSVHVMENEVVAAIEDYGREFNPLEQKAELKEGSLEERPVGGLGLHLIKEMLDAVTYRREGRKNVLEICMLRQNPDRAA
jgi:anti-sigma regulatory factor (Ser/Thr protein kinase)